MITQLPSIGTKYIKHFAFTAATFHTSGTLRLTRAEGWLVLKQYLLGCVPTTDSAGFHTRSSIECNMKLPLPVLLALTHFQEHFALGTSEPIASTLAAT